MKWVKVVKIHDFPDPTLYRLWSVDSWSDGQIVPMVLEMTFVIHADAKVASTSLRVVLNTALDFAFAFANLHLILPSNLCVVFAQAFC